MTIRKSKFETLGWWDRLTGSAPETSTLIYEGDSSSERNGIRVRPWFSI
ncbi:MAG: hypothetical protein ACLFO5_08075 [Opitutales bacterium]